MLKEKKFVKSSRTCVENRIKSKSNRNVQVYFWHNDAYNAVIFTDGEYYIVFDGDSRGMFDGVVDLYQEDVIDKLRNYIKTTDFNYFDDMYNDFSQNTSGMSPVTGRNFGSEFDKSELTKVGTIYEDKSSHRVTESDSDILDKLGITEKELQIVKDFCDNGNANEEIGFESPKYGMVMITDIFRDEEGDPVIDTIEQAVDYYGLENIRNFCKKVLRYTKRIKGESVNEARTNNPKFLSVYVSQEYVPGVGWEDINVYDDTSNASWKEAQQDVKDYKDNGYNAKVITRKIDNPNYTEPANNITFEQAVGWVKNCPYNVEELYIQYPNKNYLLKTDDIKWNPAQVFVYSDDTVRVRNCKSNRTKQVYSVDELEKEVNRILGL